MSYPRLRQAIKAGWEAVPVEYLQDLLSSMQQQCEAVITANGMNTRY